MKKNVAALILLIVIVGCSKERSCDCTTNTEDYSETTSSKIKGKKKDAQALCEAKSTDYTTCSLSSKI